MATSIRFFFAIPVILAITAIGMQPTHCFGQPRIEPLVGFSPTGVSADGKVVVGTGGRGAGSEPVIWRAGALQYLGSTGAEHTYAQNISDDGSVVIGEDYNVTGYRWTQARGFEGIHGTDIPWDLTPDGSIIVGQSTSTALTPEDALFNGGASRWTAVEGTTVLGNLLGGGQTVSSQAITPDGKVIVGFGYRDAGGRPEAFRWTQETGAIGLGDLPGGEEMSQALAVSPDGSIVVGYGTAETGQQPFRWTAATGMQGLGHLSGHVDSPYADSTATSIAPDGSFVLGHDSVGTYETVAFFWDATGGMRPLVDVLRNRFAIDTTGWQLDLMTDISADGTTLIGTGRHVDFPNPIGFRAVLVPEPSSACLAVLATILLLGTAARSRGRRHVLYRISRIVYEETRNPGN